MLTADNLIIYMCRLSLNLGVSTSWNPQGPEQTCTQISLPFVKFLVFWVDTTPPHYVDDYRRFGRSLIPSFTRLEWAQVRCGYVKKEAILVKVQQDSPKLWQIPTYVRFFFLSSKISKS